MSAALSLRAVTKRYRAGIPGCSAGADALRGVDLEVAAGDCMAIVGPAGSGKSTLLLCAAGLLRPDSGTITSFGVSMPPGHRGVSYVPDRGAFYEYLTARESLEFHLRRRLGGGVRIGRIVNATLDRVRLAARADVRIEQLRPGERRRLAIAHALLGDARLVLLDSPLSALPAPDEHDVGTTMAALADSGLTVLLSARQAATVREVASRIVRLADGRVVPNTERQARAHRVLTLTVGPADRRTRRALAELLPDSDCYGASLRIPLGDRSPEAVLAICGQLGVPVLGSCVTPALVRRPNDRVAESEPEGDAS